jgi:hypothetical protein
MQQASNISSHSAVRRAAQVIIVMLALAVMVFASCMMVTAGDKVAALTQSDQGLGAPKPGPTAPDGAT